MKNEFIVVDPKTPILGCLAVVVPESKYELLGAIERDKKNRRFIARAFFSDHIPLCGDITEVITRQPYHLVKIKENPLSMYLHHGGRNAVFYDLNADDEGFLKFVEVEIEAQLPSMAFAPARTAINELLDSMQRRAWLPLTIVRIDLLIKGEEEPFAHQLILPYPTSFVIGPIGGIHQHPVFSSYEAVLREAILSSSPYYRLLCAYRLYEGLNKLRAWMRGVSKELGITDKLPKEPLVDRDVILGVGLNESFINGVRTINDLWKKFTDLRNTIAHFFLNDNDAPLHFSDGYTYYEYSLAGAVLLYHANIAFSELTRFFNEKLSSQLARGRILPMQEYKDIFVIRPDNPNNGVE
jgi:hypothetical protein